MRLYENSSPSSVEGATDGTGPWAEDDAEIEAETEAGTEAAELEHGLGDMAGGVELWEGVFA